MVPASEIWYKWYGKLVRLRHIICKACISSIADDEMIRVPVLCSCRVMQTTGHFKQATFHVSAAAASLHACRWPTCVWTFLLGARLSLELSTNMHELIHFSKYISISLSLAFTLIAAFVFPLKIHHDNENQLPFNLYTSQATLASQLASFSINQTYTHHLVYLTQTDGYKNYQCRHSIAYFKANIHK